MQEPAGDERTLERIVKGFANHRRIQIMRLLERQPDLPLVQVCSSLRMSVKAGSEHMRKLALAGIVAKRCKGRWVLHRLAPPAQRVLAFLKTIG